jgi:hypothetical protein
VANEFGPVIEPDGVGALKPGHAGDEIGVNRQIGLWQAPALRLTGSPLASPRSNRSLRALRFFERSEQRFQHSAALQLSNI